MIKYTVLMTGENATELRLEYKMKDREVKRRATERRFAQKKYTENGITREPYLTAKKITNKRRNQVATVKSKRSETIKGKNSRL